MRTPGWIALSAVAHPAARLPLIVVERVERLRDLEADGAGSLHHVGVLTVIDEQRSAFGSELKCHGLRVVEVLTDLVHVGAE